MATTKSKEERERRRKPWLLRPQKQKLRSSEPGTGWRRPSRRSASDSTSDCASGAFAIVDRRGASETAEIFTNGPLLLPKSHGAHTIECARLHPEEWKMAEPIEHGLLSKGPAVRIEL